MNNRESPKAGTQSKSNLPSRISFPALEALSFYRNQTFSRLVTWNWICFCLSSFYQILRFTNHATSQKDSFHSTSIQFPSEVTEKALWSLESVGNVSLDTENTAFSMRKIIAMKGQKVMLGKSIRSGLWIPQAIKIYVYMAKNIEIEVLTLLGMSCLSLDGRDHDKGRLWTWQTPRTRWKYLSYRSSRILKQKKKTRPFASLNFSFTYRQDRKHNLSNIERMAKVVIWHVSIVFLNGE